MRSHGCLRLKRIPRFQRRIDGFVLGQSQSPCIVILEARPDMRRQWTMPLVKRSRTMRTSTEFPDCSAMSR